MTWHVVQLSRRYHWSFIDEIPLEIIGHNISQRQLQDEAIDI